MFLQKPEEDKKTVFICFFCSIVSIICYSSSASDVCNSIQNNLINEGRKGRHKYSFNKISSCNYKGIFYTSYPQLLFDKQNYAGRN